MIRHPLAYQRFIRGWSAFRLLRELNTVLISMGRAPMAEKRDKVNRWEGGVQPETVAQEAMAVLFGVPLNHINMYGWPQWLAGAAPETLRLDGPWDIDTAIAMLADVAAGGPMENRSFLIVSASGVQEEAEKWRDALALADRGPLIGDATTKAVEMQLQALRHLDDVAGSGEITELATAQLRLIKSLLENKTYAPATKRRLLAAAAEAARFCGWLAYDGMALARAQRYLVSSLHLSAEAGDEEVGATALSIIGRSIYNFGKPAEAVEPLETARGAINAERSPRLASMLEGYLARAHAGTGDADNTRRHLDAAAELITQEASDAPEHERTYWMDASEVAVNAGSCQMALGDYAEAISSYRQAIDARDSDQFPRDKALWLSKASIAHLELGDHEQAGAVALEAVACFTDIDSERSSGEMADLRARLTPFGNIGKVSEFLAATA